MEKVLQQKGFSDSEVKKIRNDFPILSVKAHGKPLIYFDNAATSQKPQSVIDALTEYYTASNANIHRGVHYLSQVASKKYDDTRVKIQKFINAKSEREIVFVRGTTEAINLVANSYGRKNIQQGDEIIVTAMEHHSNIVPWQLLCEEKGAKLKVIPMNDEGELLINEFEKALNPKVKFISVVHVSNSLGTINPVKEIISKAHKHNIPVLIDAAQSIVHSELDVQDLDCDFLAFSSHKMFGPTGTGVLYGKEKYLEKMPPYQGGGEMISSVSFEKTTYNDIPFKFEAGTPNIADVIALKEAISFINDLGKENIAAYESTLLAYAAERLSSIPAAKLIGTAKHKVSVQSFVIEGIHHFDVGQMLDTRGIAVRTGHHCTQPLMDHFGIEGTVRASFAVYNTKAEIDQLTEGINRIVSFMNK